jgi:hypothetical protein
MVRFYFYTFYRFTDFYKRGGESQPHIGGCCLTVFPILGYLLTIMNIIFYFLNLHLTKDIIIITGLSLLVSNGFILTNKRYLALYEKWKDERQKKIKGWCKYP